MSLLYTPEQSSSGARIAASLTVNSWSPIVAPRSCHHVNQTDIPEPLPTMPGSLSLFSVNAVLLMSADDGSRIFAKYYSPPHPPAGAAPNSTDYPGANPYPTVKEQKAFEQGLLEKTNKQTSDVILYDNRIVVFKMESDVMLYVVGSADENEVLLYNVVLSLRDALGILFKYAWLHNIR